MKDRRAPDPMDSAAGTTLGGPADPRDWLVCFDLGNVVVRICQDWRQACERAGLPVHPEVESELTRRLIADLDHRHEIHAIGNDDFYREVAKAASGRYTPREVESIHAAWLLGEHPGMSDLIDELAAAGIETACLSNTNDAHWTMMMASLPPSGSPAVADRPGPPRGCADLDDDGRQIEETGGTPNGPAVASSRSGVECQVRRAGDAGGSSDRTWNRPWPQPAFPGFAMLKHRFASHTARLAKPSPEIYRAFEQAVGRTGDRIIFFDDREDNVGAALALGWRAYVIDKSREVAEQVRRALHDLGVLPHRH